MNSARPKVLLLDLGNVTVRLKSAEFLAKLAPLCRRAPDPAGWKRILDDPSSGHHAYERGRVDGPAFHAFLVRGLGLSLDYPAWLELWNDYFEANRPMEALLAGLRGQVRFWGLSNTNAEHLGHLRREYRVLDSFEGITASNEVGAAKPEPAIYAAALRSLGVAGVEVLYLDDIPSYILAAEAFGIRGFHYTFNDAALARALEGFGLSPPNQFVSKK